MSTADQHKDNRKEAELLSAESAGNIVEGNGERLCTFKGTHKRVFLFSWICLSVSYLWPVLTVLLININRNEVVKRRK